MPFFFFLRQRSNLGLLLNSRRPQSFSLFLPSDATPAAFVVSKQGRNWPGRWPRRCIRGRGSLAVMRARRCERPDRSCRGTGRGEHSDTNRPTTNTNALWKKNPLSERCYCAPAKGSSETDGHTHTHARCCSVKHAVGLFTSLFNVILTSTKVHDCKQLCRPRQNRSPSPCTLEN